MPRITFVDPQFRFPQELKAVLGVDHRFANGLSLTLDFLWSRSVHQIDLVDVNLAPTGAVLRGEGGRPLYGSIDDAGQATPNRLSHAFTSVVRQTNASGNRYLSASALLTKRWGQHGELALAYSWSDVRDRAAQGGLGFSLSGLGLAADLIGGTALDGTLEQRRLTHSGLEVRHKIRLSGVVGLPHQTTLALIYEGSSGTPFTYVVDGDINGDGFGPELFGQQSNDIVYL